MHIFEAVIVQDLRHTGARAFVRSSAIGYDRAISRNVREMFLDLIGRDADCAGQFCFSFRPGFWIASVHKKCVFATIKAGL